MGRGRGSGAGEQGESPSYILKPGAYHSEFVWLVSGGPQLAPDHHPVSFHRYCSGRNRLEITVPFCFSYLKEHRVS